jgi:hypothetical protein
MPALQVVQHCCCTVHLPPWPGKDCAGDRSPNNEHQPSKLTSQLSLSSCAMRQQCIIFGKAAYNTAAAAAGPQPRLQRQAPAPCDTTAYCSLPAYSGNR